MHVNGVLVVIATLFNFVLSDNYKNPVVDYSLPDPTVIKGDDGYFYLYATEDIRNLPIHRSKDLVNWEFLTILCLYGVVNGPVV